MRCLYAVFGYIHFWTAINYFRRLYTTFDGHILLFRRLYTHFGGYILLSTTIYYFRRLYTTFDGHILLSVAIYYLQRYILFLALPDCDFVRIQDVPVILCICELKARFEFNINLLALIQFCFFCSSMVSSIDFNENVKFSSPCATNGWQGEQVSQQY